MQHKPFYYTILLAGICMLAACSSKMPKELRFIPNDASTVICINNDQINTKLTSAGISIDSVIQQLIKKDTGNSELVHQYQLLQKAGINFTNRVMIFKTTKVYANKSYSNFLSMIIGINDSSKLSAYLTQIDYLKGRDIHKEKEYAFIQMDGKGIISWNKENAIITMQDYTEQPRGLFPDSIMKVNETDNISLVDELKKEVNRYYTESNSASISVIPLVKDLFNQSADGYFYTNSSNALSTLNMGMLQLPKLSELLNNNITTGTFNFEKGKVAANTNFYPNKLMKAILQAYKSGKVNTKLIEHYPSKNIDFAMLMAFNPQIINGILQQLDVAPLVNGFLDKSGIPSDAVYNAFSGDMALVISDINNKNYTQNNHQWGKYLLNMAIGNDSSFHSIMDKIAEMGFITKEKDSYQSGKLMHEMHLILFANNKNMIITNDSALLVAYNNNNAPAPLSDNVLQQMQNANTFMYSDIGKLIDELATDSSNSNELIHHTFKDIIIKSEPFNGTNTSSNFVLRMQNESQNSLVSMLQLFPYISNQMQKNKAARMQDGKGNPESIFNVPFSSRLGSL